MSGEVPLATLGQVVAGQVEESWVPVLQETVPEVPALAELRTGALSTPHHQRMKADSFLIAGVRPFSHRCASDKSHPITEALI